MSFKSFFAILSVIIGVVIADDPTYNYLNNGYDWPGVCKTGKMQSPVNIANTSLPGLDDTTIMIGNMGVVNKSNFYSTSYALEVEIKGFSKMPNITVPASPFMVVNDTLVEVGMPLAVEPIQFHFHTVSEHTIEGKMSPAELHIVNQVKKGQTETCDKTGCFAVFGMMLEYPTDPLMNNTLLDIFFNNIPEMTGKSNGVNITSNIDINTLLPKKKSYYTYSGSLTTPPCTEAVQWVLFKEPIAISTLQVYAHQTMVNQLPGTDCQSTKGNVCFPPREKTNNRPVQPLNSREVTFVRAP